jgi:hypothetical protein
MNKRIMFRMLLANWIVGLVLIFQVPQTVEATTLSSGKSQLQTSKSVIADLGSLPESVTLDFDLKFLASFGFDGGNAPCCSTISFARGNSEYTTVPLFDVKQTFRHFFYTW